jgi:hypothetical protein
LDHRLIFVICSYRISMLIAIEDLCAHASLVERRVPFILPLRRGLIENEADERDECEAALFGRVVYEARLRECYASFGVSARCR